MPLTCRGFSSGVGTSSMALPTGTLVDDFIVVGAIGKPVTDARLTKVYDIDANSGVWTGYATTLDPVTLGAAVDVNHGVICGTFAPPATIGSAVTAIGLDETVEVPSAIGTAAICVQLVAAHITAGSATIPPGYTFGGQSASGSSAARFDYWNSTGDTESPAVTAPTGPNVRNWYVWVLGVDPTSIAPPARLHPRSDHLGFGSGRIFPPPSTQQAGRLTAPY